MTPSPTRELTRRWMTLITPFSAGMSSSASESHTSRGRLPAGMVLSIRSRRISGLSSASPVCARMSTSMAASKPR